MYAWNLPAPQVVVTSSRTQLFYGIVPSLFYGIIRSNSTSSNRTPAIDNFWNSFYKKIEESGGNGVYNVNLYHNEVIKLLVSSKSMEGGCSQDKLFSLQRDIEDLTLFFEEKSIFRTYPSLIKLLIHDDMITAKEYLMQKRYLLDTDLACIKIFGKYTLEAIIINVLGSVFNYAQSLSVVRLSTLIHQIDSAVRVQAINMGMKIDMKKKADKLVVSSLTPEKKRKITRSHYAIGVGLVELLVERQLITLETTGASYMPQVPVSKIKGYILNCYAVCNFDLSILPIKLNLPMVCKPAPWNIKADGDGPITLADIEGGYLSGLTGDLSNRFRLLTSRNYSHFFIKLNSPGPLLKILNALQSQAFQINDTMLSFIMNNREALEEAGILMNRSLARLNLQEASGLLRFCYFNDDAVKKECSCNHLLMELYRRAQQARYEDFVLTLANAYAGYKFYLPAFMDFRGRIYRAGVLHFHERDLARSLIIFASDGAPEPPQCDGMFLRQLASAAVFKYKNFLSLENAYSWYRENHQHMIESDKSLIHLALKASDPYQFIAKVLFNERTDIRICGLNSIPVNQDASASAYQIMSYLLLNVEMGRLTNLIPSPEKEIQDLYMCLKNELKEFLHSRLDDNMFSIIESGLTRKIVKLLFMPLIYGKTVIAMADDIREAYGELLRRKDHYHIAKLCYEFWINKYPDIANLMKLINLIGGLCSALDRPVIYSIPYFTTVQDYMRSEKAHIWVYDRVCRKRRQATLRVPTSVRDKRKTKVSTCVNFIHQKDAYIAMKVVDELTLRKAPVYTVHDNFITTSVFAAGIPNIYTKVYMDMGHPLRIINEFIYSNLKPSPSPTSWLSYNPILEDPISGESLRRDLGSLQPKDSSIKDTILWCSMIDDIASCYERYVSTVCGEALDGGMCQAEKWNEFYEQLKSWESLEHNYSVHY